MPTAIVLSCHFNGLSLVQELGSNGVPCVAMDCVRSIGTFSRYGKFVRCPNPSQDESTFVDFLYDYCAAQPVKPVLFPTNDEWAVAVSRARARLSEVAIPCVAEWPAVQIVIEKDRFYDVARQRSYPVPATWERDELETLTPDDFPIVAKPRFRRNASDGELVAVLETMRRLRLTVFDGAQDLARFLAAEESATSHLVFQEFVRGASDSMYTVGLYVDPNRVTRGVFTGRKVRGYPALHGDCTVGEVHEVPEEIVELSVKVAADLGLTGILELEYKRDTSTDEYRLIEINPRSWSWIGITPSCGVSLPLIAYRDLVSGPGRDGPPLRSVAADSTVRYYRLIPDLINSTAVYRHTFPSWRQTPLSWWRELHRTPRVVVAEFHARDPLVGLVALITEGREMLRRLRRVRSGH
jgi:predicted ATP-grasp superfamily ATP-dependent carboligase